MRNPERIKEILKELEIYWENNPDMRLGQIIAYLVGRGRHSKFLFYTEDDIILKRLKVLNK